MVFLQNVAKLSSELVNTFMQQLLDRGQIVKVNQINKTKFLQPDSNRKWEEDKLYAWIFEGSQLHLILGGVAALLIAFSLVLYRLWPRSMKLGAWYLSMVGVAFLAFIFAISILRLVVFALTLFLVKPGVWIFPNLYEDVGFFASFAPLWSWHKPE